MTQVRINVSGTVFEVDRKFLHSNEFQKLSSIYEDFSRTGSDVKELKINRPSSCFNAVLTYHQTGELHMPTGLCPGVFKKELEFWELDYGVMQDCCLYKFQTFLDDEKTRKNFLQRAVTTAKTVSPIVSSTVIGKFRKFRKRLWKIVDNNETTIIAKIYFILVFFLVMLSIVSMAYSTEPSMRRSVTECEMLEYMEHSENEHMEKVKEIFGNPDCSSGEKKDKPLDISNYDWSFYRFSWGWSLERFTDTNTNTPSTNSTTTTANPKRNFLRQILQGTNFRKWEIPTQEEIDVPELTVPKEPFHVIDYVLSAFFTIDLILRLFSCPSIPDYFRSVINVFDALALLCSYVYKITVSIEREYIYLDSTWILFLDYMQILRTLRLFRVVKNVRASKVLAYSLTQDVRDMSLLGLLLVVGISTFACLFYFSESRENIPSIPVAWYWAIVTMTTVGYGDISPETGFGRVISSICAVCGVLLLAVTLPMFVNNFLTLYQYSCVNESIEQRRNEQQGNTKADEKEQHNDAARTKDKTLTLSTHQSDRMVSPPPAYSMTIKPVNTVQEVKVYHVKEAAVKHEVE